MSPPTPGFHFQEAARPTDRKSRSPGRAGRGLLILPPHAFHETIRRSRWLSFVERARSLVRREEAIAARSAGLGAIASGEVRRARPHRVAAACPVGGRGLADRASGRSGGLRLAGAGGAGCLPVLHVRQRAQRVATARQAGADGADWNAQNLGDLLVRHLLEPDE